MFVKRRVAWESTHKHHSTAQRYTRLLWVIIGAAVLGVLFAFENSHLLQHICNHARYIHTSKRILRLYKSPAKRQQVVRDGQNVMYNSPLFCSASEPDTERKPETQNGNQLAKCWNETDNTTPAHGSQQHQPSPSSKPIRYGVPFSRVFVCSKEKIIWKILQYCAHITAEWHLAIDTAKPHSVFVCGIDYVNRKNAHDNHTTMTMTEVERANERRDSGRGE